ncbi:Spy/CpxP family protein refolding chaperone [Methylocystis echinoides]|uniref:Spy/CpxP family protein refolding chaperone n=1 Tax=Methylocystis echinoides TaxID=29468 RepID=UPI0034415D43
MTGRAFSVTTSFAALALALGLISARAEDVDHSKMDHGAMDHSAHGAGATQWADPGKAQATPPATSGEAPKADEHAGHHGGGAGGGMMGGMGGMMGGGMSHGGGSGGMDHGGSGGGMGGMMGGMSHGGGSGGMDHGGSGGGMGGMGGMMQHMMCGFTEHLEGRLAYLKAELKLTDQQTTAWSNFADAWRAVAQKAKAKCAATDDRPDSSRPAVLQKLDKMENHMADHLDIVRAQKAAIEPLFTTLSDEQKKIASETMTSMMKVGMSMMGGGMGGMMGGMGGMMGGMSHGGGSGGGMQH